MKQNILRKLMLIAVLLIGSHAFAYDFEVDGLCYNILSNEEQTVETTYRTSDYNSYSGDIVIPQTVNYNGKAMSVIKIGLRTFYKCNNLSSVEIPEGIISIEGWAFCLTSLKSIKIPNSVETLSTGEYQGVTFGHNSSLETVELGNNIKFLGQNLFENCPKLISINIPNSVDSISCFVFNGCSKIETITIPSSVRVIGGQTFNGCDKLKYVIMKGLIAPEFQGTWGIDEYDTYKLKVPKGCLSSYQKWSALTMEEYKLDIEINGINYNIISIEDKTAEVTFKGELSYYRESTYTGKVIIPNTITYDGITFDVVRIGTESFYYCPEMTSLTIPASVKTIEEYSMSNCDNLKELILEDGDVALSGYTDFRLCPIETLYLGRDINISNHQNFPETIKTLLIGNKVTTICDNAFDNCTALETVKIESQNLNIGSYAFSGCSKLSKINLDGATKIGGYAFADCINLKELKISENISSIDSYAFYNCSGLNTFIINGLGSVSSNAFKKCSGNLIVNCNIPKESANNNSTTGVFRYSEFSSLTLGEDVDSIGSFAFYGCEWLKSLVIPKNIKSIGDYAFSGCSGLEETIINEPFSIGWYSLGNCTGHLYINCDIPDAVKHPNSSSLTGFFYGSNFTSVTISNNVSAIGTQAFENCSSITEFICESVTPPTAYSTTFKKVSQTAILYVPVGSKDAYASATGWSTFTNIVEDDVKTGVESTLADNNVNVSVENGNIIITGTGNAKVEVYSINGQLIYNGNATTIPVTAKGMYIVKVNNKSFKVVL